MRQISAHNVGTRSGSAGDPITIDLRARFGDRYRIGWEAGSLTRSAWPRKDHIWLQELRCKYGAISPFGGSILQATTSDHPRIGARLRQLPCVLTARGDVETVITFAVKDIESVFAVLQPYRRRQLSEEQRAKLVDRLLGVRQKAQKSPCESEYSADEATQRVAANPLPAPEGNGH